MKDTDRARYLTTNMYLMFTGDTHIKMTHKTFSNGFYIL